MGREVSEYVGHEVYEPGAEDAHGNEIESWSPGVQVGIFAFDPGSMSEPREAGRDLVVVQPSILLPASTIFAARDRVIARGETFDVEGGTRQWRHPNGSIPGNMTTLRKVAG